jgi:hypothetical protein
MGGAVMWQREASKQSEHRLQACAGWTMQPVLDLTQPVNAEPNYTKHLHIMEVAGDINNQVRNE